MAGRSGTGDGAGPAAGVHPVGDPGAGDAAAGARNLLAAAGAEPGDRVLIVGEAGPDPWFDPGLCEIVAGAARGAGMLPRVLLARPGAGAEEIPAEIPAAMDAADRTIFLSRLGDQVRFRPDLVRPGTVMSYTVDAGYLGSAFGRVDQGALWRVHDALVRAVLGARSYRITAPCGTDLAGRIVHGEAPEPAMSGEGADAGAQGDGPALTDFAVTLFPVMIFPPVTCAGLEGVLVIDRFVTSTSTRAYAGSVLPVETPVRAIVEDSRIVRLEGPAPLSDALREQMERAAALTGGDPWRINSWHTGINPFTYWKGRAADDPERWGTVAYGSPRYTHFHASGRDPGDLAFHLMDATIAFDGVPAWEEGRFTFLDRPEIRALAPGLPDSGHRLPIGL